MTSTVRISAQDVAALVRPGDRIDFGAGLVQRDALERALPALVDELHDVTIGGCLSVRSRPVLQADPDQRHVSFANWHFGGHDRAANLWHRAVASRAKVVVVEVDPALPYDGAGLQIAIGAMPNTVRTEVR